jgi:hypothetical protein
MQMKIMAPNNTLAEMIRRLRGPDNYVKFAKRTGVNRQTLTELEDGESVRMETLQRIAQTCKLDEREWAEMLIAWIRCAMGEREFAKLDVRPAPTPTIAKKLKATDEMFLTLFHRLGYAEKANILKAMMRSEVRSCLPGINSVWEMHIHVADMDRVVKHEVPQQWEDFAAEVAKLEDVTPPATRKGRTA